MPKLMHLILVLAAGIMSLLPAQARAKSHHMVASSSAPGNVQDLAPLPSHLPTAVSKAIAEKNWVEARLALEKLVANGDAEAKGLLGMLLLRGADGAKPDVEQGKKLLEQAARQGDSGAQRNLAQLYFLGGFTNGIPQYSEAYKYVDPLATKRDPVGMYYASKYFFEGLLGVRDLSVGMQLLKDSAQMGARSAQYDLALLYRRGLPGAEPDPKTALFWLEHAGKQNHADGAYETGMAYLFGLGTNVNTNKAVSWLNKAGSLGNVNAPITLAKLYQTGKGVPLNMAKAKELYLFAADKRIGTAFVELSAMVNDPKAGTADPVQALTYAMSGELLGSEKAKDQAAKLRVNLSPAQVADAEQRLEAWKKTNNITNTKPRISALIDTQ